eukprot:COSAG06_NODE_4250_length_4433_cov_1.907014_3_plen_99_part_00
MAAQPRREPLSQFCGAPPPGREHWPPPYGARDICVLPALRTGVGGRRERLRNLQGYSVRTWLGTKSCPPRPLLRGRSTLLLSLALGAAELHPAWTWGR